MWKIASTFVWLPEYAIGLENFQCGMMLGSWEWECIIGHDGLFLVVAANQMN